MTGYITVEIVLEYFSGINDLVGLSVMRLRVLALPALVLIVKLDLVCTKR